MTALGVEPADAYHGGSELLEELRAQTLRAVSLALLVIAYASIALLVTDRHLETWFVPLSLGAAAILSYLMIARSVLAASITLCAGLLLALGGSLWVFPNSYQACFFALVVTLTAVLLRPVAAVAVALSASALTVVAAAGTKPVVDQPIAIAAILLALGSALLAWASARPVYAALDWAWGSYLEALDGKREAERHRGELGRVVKSLNEAYRRLELLNRELTLAREEALEARRLKAEFAANISHELRTPLNLIVGFSELMVRSPHTYGAEPLPPAYRGDVDAIYRNAKHLSGLIDDVLDLSQIEAGRLGLSREWAPLTEIVAEAMNAVQALFVAKGLALDAEIPDGLPLLHVDRTRVRQILINLLANAVRFTERGGVRVSGLAREQEVVVSVADTGVGIAPEDVPKVFEQFRQLDGSPRRRHGGTGLGLALSRQFAEMHGGAMWLESQSGQGSTFYFSLPTGATFAGGIPRLSAASRHLPANQYDGANTLAVITEDPAVAALFRRHLDGYQVLPVEDVAGIPRLASRALLRGVIAVASSPEESWRQLTEVSKLPLDLPVVACALPSRRELSRRLGVAGYLIKPVSREQVIASLRQLGEGVHNVLVVDDEPEVVRLLARMLQSARRGFRAWRAYSGAEALALLRERRPDAVLLDLLMPEIDGYAVLQHIQSDEGLRDVPVIVVSARGAEDEAVTSGLIGITRQRGLTVRELMACTAASFEALTARSRSGDGPVLAAGRPG